MNTAMYASTLVNQESLLPDNNEEVINMLGLDEYVDSNTGKLVNDIVMKLDLDAFAVSQFGEPRAPIGFECMQGHQQVVGNPLGGYQPTELVSYVDLSPVSPYSINNSPYHVPECSLFFNEDNSQPASPQDVSSVLPTTSIEIQDSRTQAGGKTTTRRRREPKTKLYEHEDAMSDPEEEKKRQNAINAKKNRDKQKTRLQELEILVNALTSERDALKSSNTKARNKCDAFERQLKNICQQFNVPVIILPQD